MDVLRLLVVSFGTMIVLAGCAGGSALWPSLEGGPPAGTATTATTAATSAPAATGAGAAVTGAAAARPATGPSAPPPVGTTSFKPPGVTPGTPTGTFVGDKVIQLRNELKRLQEQIGAHNDRLQQLRAKVVADSQRYHGTVAAINARLQVGTTPGNPILVEQFNSAETDLDRLAADIGEMNELATEVTADATMAAYLSEATRAAFHVSGAVDEDHRQLAILQDEVDRTSVLIDRLLSELSDDVRRQTEYVATERSNLNLLATGIRSGEIYGPSLVNQAEFAARARSAPPPPSSGDFVGRRPLVVIRFDRDNVPYQQPLYNAVSKALERQPNATFDLVAVAPAAATPGRVALNTNKVRRQAEGVMRALIDMGLPRSRIAMITRTSKLIRTNEVRLYVR